MRKWKTLAPPKIKKRYPFDVLVPERGRGKWLAGMVREHNWAFGAEIGVLRGDNLFYLLDNCPRLSMVGVDAWRKRPECRSAPHGAGYQTRDMVAIGLETLERSRPYGKRVQIMHMESVEAAKKFPDETFDFVFIDASHDTDSVAADIRAWTPKVKLGGYVTGHDYLHPGVLPAVQQTLPKARPVSIDNCWFWQRC